MAVLSRSLYEKHFHKTATNLHAYYTSFMYRFGMEKWEKTDIF